VEINAALVSDPLGNPLHIQSIVRDVSARKRADRLIRKLNEATLGMQKAFTPEKIFDSVGLRLEEIGIRCVVFLVDESQNKTFSPYSNIETKLLQAAEILAGVKTVDYSVSIDDVKILRDVIRDKQVIFTKDMVEITKQMLPPYLRRFARRIVKILKVSNSIFAPLVLDDKVVGMLTLISDELVNDDKSVVLAFAYQIGAAWRRTELVQELELELSSRTRTEGLVRVLNSASVAMQAAKTQDEIFSSLDSVLQKLPLFCSIFIMENDTNSLRIHDTNFTPKVISNLEKLVSIKLIDFSIPIDGVDIFYKAIQGRESFFVEDTESVIKQMLPVPVRRFTKQISNVLKIPRFIVAPLIADDDVIGVITVQSDDLLVSDVPAVTALGHQLAISWRNVKLMRDLEVELIERELAEERFRSIFENAVMGLYRTTPSGAILMANPALVNMLGYPSFDELVSRNLEKDGYAARFSRQEFKERIEREDQVLGLESAWKTRDGENLHIRESARAIRDEKGDVMYYEGTVEDITQRIQMEVEREQLLTSLEKRNTQLRTATQVSKFANTILNPSTLIEQSVSLIRDRFGFNYVGLFLVDDEGDYAVLWAGTGEAGREMKQNNYRLPLIETSMIGWSIKNVKPRISLDVGQDAIRFNNPLLPDTRSEMALPLISRQRCIGALSVQSTEAEAFSEADIDILQAMAEQIATAIENARLYETAQYEIAERKLAEDRIRNLNEELEERVKERTFELEATNLELEAFAYSVSHDLRTPLRGIDGFSQALIEEYHSVLDEEGKDYLDRVRKGTQKMGELIDDILKLSRITRHDMNLELIDMSGMVEGISQEIKLMEPERKFQFKISKDTHALGDKHLVGIALENLLGNSAKYTSRKPTSKIEFGVRNIKGDDVFFIQDNGAGFNMEYSDKLFIPFQRLHSSYEFPGSGVGLSIVSRIINKHNGKIWAEGKEGEMAVFYFTLGLI